MPESEALMSDRVTIDQMASAIMEGLTEYADLATNELKKSVKKAGKTVKDEISKTAPKDTGRTFQKPLPDRASPGTRSCKARRRESGSKTTHRTCGGEGHRGTRKGSGEGTGRMSHGTNRKVAG